jgi:mono/diheme cytochrome c family protein
MKLKFLAVVFVGVALVGTVGTSRMAAQAKKTVWDGVYTGDQAKRGEALYSTECASCHGPELNGGEMAPGLTGGEFSANWSGLSLGDLFERMRISMPQNKPGSLSRQQNADVLAFILQRNKMPLGKADLPTQTEELKTVNYEATKP